jgi:hypothetical protein
MQTIWKLDLEIKREVQSLEMAAEAEILTLQMQHGVPCIWFRCYPRDPLVTRRFVMIGTGWNFSVIPNPHKYIGTVQDGSLVWHFFELLE